MIFSVHILIFLCICVEGGLEEVGEASSEAPASAQVEPPPSDEVKSENVFLRLVRSVLTVSTQYVSSTVVTIVLKDGL